MITYRCYQIHITYLPMQEKYMYSVWACNTMVFCQTDIEYDDKDSANAAGQLWIDCRHDGSEDEK